mgnify:CR=1 FL=1|tara:strand:+ start:1485 stop:1958 length:474 start_codon:yes stop_codon:yes gene_type:complete
MSSNHTIESTHCPTIKPYGEEEIEIHDVPYKAECWIDPGQKLIIHPVERSQPGYEPCIEDAEVTILWTDDQIREHVLEHLQDAYGTEPDALPAWWEGNVFIGHPGRAMNLRSLMEEVIQKHLEADGLEMIEDYNEPDPDAQMDAQRDDDAYFKDWED